MKKTEIVLIISFVLGTIIMILKFSVSGILISTSLFLLSMLYFYLGFALFNNISFKKSFKKESYKETSTKRIIFSIASGFILSILTIGLLFKFLMWPGEYIQIVIGLSGLCILLIITLLKYRKSPDKFYSGMLKRIIFFGVIGILTINLPPKTLLDWKFPNNPDYVHAILKFKANPNNLELWENVEKERKKME